MVNLEYTGINNISSKFAQATETPERRGWPSASVRAGLAYRAASAHALALTAKSRECTFDTYAHPTRLPPTHPVLTPCRPVGASARTFAIDRAATATERDPGAFPDPAVDGQRGAGRRGTRSSCAGRRVLGDLGQLGDLGVLGVLGVLDQLEANSATLGELSDLGDLGDLGELSDLGDLGDTRRHSNPRRYSNVESRNSMYRVP